MGTYPEVEEYLTVKELSARIKMAVGTVRNLVWKMELKEGVHYVKPTPRKILFIWSAVEAWLHRSTDTEIGVYTKQDSKPKSLINI